jgi:hypothetical protein
MGSPYSHPSMPGTPADFPSAVTAFPKGPSPWHDTCASPAETIAALITPLLAQPLEPQA